MEAEVQRCQCQLEPYAMKALTAERKCAALECNNVVWLDMNWGMHNFVHTGTRYDIARLKAFAHSRLLEFAEVEPRMGITFAFASLAEACRWSKGAIELYRIRSTGSLRERKLRARVGKGLRPQRRLGTKKLFWKAKQDPASSFFQRAAPLPLIYQAARGEWRDICRVG